MNDNDPSEPLKRIAQVVEAAEEVVEDVTTDDPGSNKGLVDRKRSAASALIDLAENCAVFHAPDKTAYIDIEVDGHRETWSVRSSGFRQWLSYRYFDTTGGAAGKEALESALNVIEAKARFRAPEHQVHVRVGALDGKLYLDLGDPTWRAVEIDAGAWRVIDRPPVRFRRASGALALPIPVAGGSIGTLRSFLNVRSDADFTLVVAWALACLRDRGPYPVLALSGEQGSAKSTFSAMLRSLLDPNSAPLRALPREDRDLFIAASNAHLLAFDNVSSMPPWTADTLCRLATGGGFAVRRMYSDQDEVLFTATRPVILNGIEDIVTRPDLADRAIFLALESIPDERRRSELELWAAFDVERPRLLGVLLDAVAEGIKRLPGVRLSNPPRMADFASWATACETALWPAGTFWSAYCANREEAVVNVIDADPIAAAVRALVAAEREWRGTATELLEALGRTAGDRTAKSKDWPGSPRALSGRVRRAATFLRKVGIEIATAREGRSGNRTMIITSTSTSAANVSREGPGGSSAPSAPSATLAANDLAATSPLTVASGADDRAAVPAPTVSGNALNLVQTSAADDADAKLGAESVAERPKWRGRL